MIVGDLEEKFGKKSKEIRKMVSRAKKSAREQKKSRRRITILRDFARRV